MDTSSSGERVIYEHKTTKETQRMSHYAYMVGVPVFDPGHHTMAQCCSCLLPKDASVSQLLNLPCYSILALYHGDSGTRTLVLQHSIP
jgi:hypothetical protein